MYIKNKKMAAAYYEIVNTSIGLPFNNASNNDFSIRTDGNNQQILLGNGSNTNAGMAISNNIVSLYYAPTFTPAVCMVYPNFTKSFTNSYYDYLAFSSAIISNSNFFSVNIDSVNGYNNYIKFLQPGTYSVMIHFTPSTNTQCRFGYSINYFNTPIAIDNWSNIPFAPSNNGSGMVASVISSTTDFTRSLYDIYTAKSNDLLRVHIQFANATGTIYNYFPNVNGTTKIVIALLG